MKQSKLILLAVAGLLLVAQSTFATDGPPEISVPDAGTSAMLLTLAMGGLTVARNFFRK